MPTYFHKMTICQYNVNILKIFNSSTLKRFDPTRFWQFCKVGHLTGCDSSSKAGCTTRTATLQTCSKWRIPVALVASFMFSRLTNTPTRAPTYYRKKRHASGDMTYSDCIGWVLVRSCKSIGRHRETTILDRPSGMILLDVIKHGN